MPRQSVPPSLEGLVDLERRSGVDIRPTLLRVLTDLYVQKPAHTAAEEAQYVELAQRLIETVDERTRNTVAGRLAAYPRPPQAIVRRLLELGNKPKIAPDVPQPAAASTDIAAAFFAAARDERRLVLANLALSAPPAHLPAAADTIAICRQLETAALARNTGEFTRILERALGISAVTAERIVADASGEPLVVAARALGMTAEVVQRILLFINAEIGQSVQKVYDLAELYYEVTAEAAAAMVELWRGRGAARRATHRSVYYDDERTDARSSATPAPRPAARRGGPLQERYRTSGR